MHPKYRPFLWGWRETWEGKIPAVYLSDSKLTPRWLYAGLLRQMGLEPHYFSGDSKRLLQKEICAVVRVKAEEASDIDLRIPPL